MILRPWNENIWFSPCYVINELTREAMIGDPQRFKRAKEAWICAVAVICHSSYKPAEWWIQLPKTDPPDVLAMNLVPTPDGTGQNLSELKVEVFEISAFDANESIEQSIERKLNGKDYSGMTLIGFVRREGFFNHVEIAKYIQNLKPNVLALNLIVFEEMKSTNVTFIQLFPEVVKFKADFGQFCKTTKQRDFIEIRRGMKTEKDDATTTDWLTMIP